MIGARVARFWADEAGAVTVDWLALTAAAVGVGLLGADIIAQSTADTSNEIEAMLRDAKLGSITFVDSSTSASSSASGASISSLKF